MEHDASFGHWLTVRRQAVRLQRAELAARLGCAAVTLQKIELDERRPSRQLAERLADQLAIPAQDREIFIRVARGELSVDRLAIPGPSTPGPSNLPRSTTALATPPAAAHHQPTLVAAEAQARYAAIDLFVRRAHAVEEALVPLRQQGITFGIVRTLLALGHTLFEQGDLTGATVQFRAGLALSQESPLLTTITIGLEGLAMIAAATEQPVRAARLWGTAETLREATDERRWHVFQHAYDHTLAAARAQLAEPDWTIA